MMYHKQMQAKQLQEQQQQVRLGFVVFETYLLENRFASLKIISLLFCAGFLVFHLVFYFLLTFG